MDDSGLRQLYDYGSKVRNDYSGNPCGATYDDDANYVQSLMVVKSVLMECFSLEKAVCDFLPFLFLSFF